MRRNESRADSDAQRRNGRLLRQPEVRPDWWQSRGVDLVVRLIGTALAAAGALILYLLNLYLGRYSSVLLAFVLGSAGALLLFAGAAVTVIAHPGSGVGRRDPARTQRQALSGGDRL